MKPLNPNSMIQGRYLIVQPIGKGGMGEVYLAVDQRLGSAVALKRTFFSDDSTLGTAFEREARILARLRHPVLPKVIDHFAENGDQYLVMEHISGDDIAKRLESANKPFPVSWVMFWSDQMLDALAYLHSHEPPIVHRDIKPQNLKLTDDNHIVLLDFGLSKDFDSRSSGLNSASVAGYSPHFASMEQIRGTGTDARSDLYSLAATLYQMLTNVVPVDALTRADAMLGGKPDPIQPLNELNSEVAAAISEVILKAVSIRQDDRFNTALEMQKALRRAFNSDKSDASTKPGTEPKIAPATAKLEETPPPVVKEVSEAPEFETHIRSEALVPLDETMQLDPANFDSEPQKQSEVKTAVYTAETPLVEQAAATNQVTAEPPKAVAAVAGLSSAAAASPGAQAAAPRKASPKPEPKRSKAGLIVGLLLAVVLLGGVGGGAAWWMLRSRGSAVTGNQNTPANVPTPAATPMQAETNTNSAPASNTEIGGTTNTNSAVANTAQTSSTTPAGNKTQTTATTPAKPTSPTKPATGDKTAPPKTKPKEDRTVILQ